jgi:hypothetical protein
MTTAVRSAALATIQPVFTDAERIALAHAAMSMSWRDDWWRWRRPRVVMSRLDGSVRGGQGALMLQPGPRLGEHGRAQFTLRKTIPGPGSYSATTALRMALVMPPWAMISPNRDAFAAAGS